MKKNSIFGFLGSFFFSLFVFCPFVGFCVGDSPNTGICHVSTGADGSFTIICEGSGIDVNYIELTNEVYIISNCEGLKTELISYVSSVNSRIDFTIGDLDNALFYISQVKYEANSSNNSFLIVPATQAENSINAARTSLLSIEDSLMGPTSLVSRISSIQCETCSTNSSGSSSCGCDLSEVHSVLYDILSSLNSSYEKLESISDDIQAIRATLTGSLSRTGQDIYRRQLNTDNTTLSFSYYTGSSSSVATIRNMLYNLQDSLGRTQASINNYLYFIKSNISQGFGSTTNLLISATNYLSLSYVAQTNHFSFFREMSFQDSPMVDYIDYSSSMTRYEFLTNHYIRLVENSTSDMSDDEKSKTNWFSRIETLLAALVFQDAEKTNTVDSSFGEQERDRVIDGLDGLEGVPTSRITAMDNVGRGMISVLSDLSSSFSSAVELPSEVNLVTLPDSSDSRNSSSISFQTSAIRNLIEVCHCATTLAWCFGGLWLFYLFVSWSVKTSYSLVVFCWSVVSGVFGGGK